MCLCKIQNCDHAYGCIQPTKSKFPQQLSIKCTIYFWSSYLLYQKKRWINIYYLDRKIFFFIFTNESFVTEYKFQFTIHNISITTTKRLLEMDNVSSNKGKKRTCFYFTSIRNWFTMYLYCVCLLTLRFVEKKIV